MNRNIKRKSFKESLKNASRGLKYVLKTERNARIIFLCGVIAILLGFLVKLSFYEICLIILTVWLVFMAEIFNTLIEDLIDLFRNQKDPGIKLLKDTSSGAVLLASICSVIIGIFIFLPRILEILK